MRMTCKFASIKLKQLCHQVLIPEHIFSSQSMGVDTLSQGRHQPFYQVLADERDRAGGMITYVAQVALVYLESQTCAAFHTRDRVTVGMGASDLGASTVSIW